MLVLDAGALLAIERGQRKVVEGGRPAGELGAAAAGPQRRGPRRALGPAARTSISCRFRDSSGWQ
jgi:hypothetical protein